MPFNPILPHWNVRHIPFWPHSSSSGQLLSSPQFESVPTATLGAVGSSRWVCINYFKCNIRTGQLPASLPRSPLIELVLCTICGAVGFWSVPFWGECRNWQSKCYCWLIVSFFCGGDLIVCNILGWDNIFWTGEIVDCVYRELLECRISGGMS